MKAKQLLWVGPAFPALLLIPSCRETKGPAISDKPNVLFIFVDDLRREMGAYGSPVLTPNMDALAASGSLFTRQFVPCPTSGASRYGLLTGMYPSDPSHLSNEACRTELSGRPEGDRPETMFHQLRRHGYRTVGIGKISHYVDGCLYGYEAPKTDIPELPYSWDEMLFDAGKWGNGWNAFFGYADGTNRQSRHKQVKPYECFDGDDESYPDGLTARLAVSKLKELAAGKEPFCLAVGFFKPHLPFTSPKAYWDLYDEESIALSPEPDIPEGMNRMFLHDSDEFNSYQLGDEKPSMEVRVSDAYARKLRHAYYACVSYADAQVGKVLSALEESGLADNTVVILWGDHGWHLGDQRIWGKHTVLETASSSALVIRAPGRPQGIVNDRIVSAIDLYPTLMALCGVPCPEGLDGHSLVPLLDRPDDPSWQDVAYTYYRHVLSVRTPQYRLARCVENGVVSTELYEYGPDRIEHRNIAAEKPGVVAELIPLWEKGLTGAFR
jgi:arylsulfatase A-like enzyme